MAHPQPQPAGIGAAASAAGYAAMQLEEAIRHHVEVANRDPTGSVTPSAEPEGSTDTIGGDSDDGYGQAEEKKITEIARQMSRLSRQSSVRHPLAAGEPTTNPFVDPEADPELNPHSEQFNSRRWLKNMLQITARDPERYPRRTAGVSFRNLNVYGYGTAADYQTDVANMWLKTAGWFRGLMGAGKKVRIDILRGFEGMVRSGELLVVLGRPGR